MIMPKRARFIKRPEIMLDATLPVPLYKQLYERLRTTILAGQLERGARLPSTRTLASELGISRSTRRFLDVHLPILEQMALFDFLNEGHFARHLRQTLQQYRKLRDLLHRELQAHLGGLLDVYAPEAGINLVGWLPPGKDDQRAAQLAAGAGIEVMAISKFSLEPLPRGGLLFGYAGTNEEAILHGVKKLAVALEQL
jgi:DNA-binding transcriptional MocR family regulator